MTELMDAVEEVWDDDLLPEELLPPEEQTPVVTPTAPVPSNATRLAQIVNLHIGGWSLADIGASIGATEAEVDRMLTQDMARYVRSQPALRTYVRNFLSTKYLGLLDASYPIAVDPARSEWLDAQNAATRVLDRMAKLHGAEVPTQSEVKIDTAPEAVERLVAAIAANQGLGYDASVFDVPPEDIHEAVVVSERELEVSGNRVEEDQPGDGPL